MILTALCLRARDLKIFTDLALTTFDVVPWKQFTLMISVPEVT